MLPVHTVCALFSRTAVEALWFPRRCRNGICLWLVIVMFRAAGEAFQVWYFDRTGIIFSRRYGWVWIVIGLSLVCAYSCWAVDPFVRAAWLFHPICLVLICGMGIVSIWYLMAGYQGYRQKLHRTMEEKWMLSLIMKKPGRNQKKKKSGCGSGILR